MVVYCLIGLARCPHRVREIKTLSLAFSGIILSLDSLAAVLSGALRFMVGVGNGWPGALKL